MGLDMYLSAARYLAEYNDEEKMIAEKIKELLPDVVGSFKEIKTRVAYWRKANHIHKWFVDNVQGGKDDCAESSVSIEHLQELHDLCVTLLKTKNVEQAKELLPTESGFFFGSTEIDEYYYEDLQVTVDQLAPLLTEATRVAMKQFDYYYRSSW